MSDEPETDTDRYVKIMDRMEHLHVHCFHPLSRITPCEAEQLMLVPRDIAVEAAELICAATFDRRLDRNERDWYEDALARVREYLKAQEETK